MQFLRSGLKPLEPNTTPSHNQMGSGEPLTKSCLVSVRGRGMYGWGWYWALCELLVLGMISLGLATSELKCIEAGILASIILR